MWRLKLRCLATREQKRIVKIRDDTPVNPVEGEPAREAGLSEARQVEQQLTMFFNVALDLLSIANFEGYFIRLSPAWTRKHGPLCGHFVALRASRGSKGTIRLSNPPQDEPMP